MRLATHTSRVARSAALGLLFLLAFVGTSAAPMAQVDFPITFEDDIDYGILGFAGAEASEIVTDPSDDANSVVRVIRAANAETYAGTVIANSGLAEPVPFAPGATTISVRVWTPEAGTPVRFKVENSANGAVFVETELNSTMSGAWETLVFDFADEATGSPALDFSATYDKLVVFFDFGAAGAAESTYYFDDIVFGSGEMSGPSLVINEVDADTPGADIAEFVEIYNAGDADATLDGHVIVFFNGNGDSSYGAFDLTGTLAPGEYYVLGNPGVANVNQTFDPGSSGFLQNGADAVALYTGATTDFPFGTAATTTNLIDAIVYDTDDSDDTGLLAALGETTQYDEAANGNKDNESIQRVPDGDEMIVTAIATPGAANAANLPPATLTALLRGANEVEPVMTDAKGGVTVDIDGTTVTVTGAFAGLESDYNAAVGSHIHGGAADENGPAVVALMPTLDADNRGGTYEASNNTFEVRATFADSIRAGLAYVNIHTVDNAGGEIRGQLGTDVHELPFALNGANERPDPVETDATGSGTVSLDGTMVTLTGSFSGLSGDYSASHIHMGAADESGGVVVTLSATVDGDNRGGTWDAANNMFEVRSTFADSIRAGLAYVNVHSAAHGSGEIRGQIGTEGPLMIITIAEARAAGVGTTVTVEGTVTRAEGAFTYFQDATGGLTIRQTSGAFFDAVTDGSIAPGTELRVTGKLSEFASLLQINGDDLTSYEVLGMGDVPAAQNVTLAELAANGEDYEAELVTVGGVEFAVTGAFTAATTYQVTDGSGAANAVSVRVPNADDTTVEDVTIPARANLTGVVGQYDNSDPAAGYQLLLLDAADIVNSTANEGDGAAVLSLTVVNPIRRDATVRFSLDAPGTARVALYDALGREVLVVAEGEMTLGAQTARLDAGQLASGVYVLRLEAGTGAVARTITVVR